MPSLDLRLVAGARPGAMPAENPVAVRPRRDAARGSPSRCEACRRSGSSISAHTGGQLRLEVLQPVAHLPARSAGRFSAIGRVTAMPVSETSRTVARTCAPLVASPRAGAILFEVHKKRRSTHERPRYGARSPRDIGPDGLDQPARVHGPHKRPRRRRGDGLEPAVAGSARRRPEEGAGSSGSAWRTARQRIPSTRRRSRTGTCRFST